MATRTPLILNQIAGRIEELAVGDTLSGSIIEAYGGKNRIINGDFRFWQRGTNFPAATGQRYTADRWQANGIGSTVWVQRVDVPPGGGTVPMLHNSKYMLQAVVNSVAGAGNLALIQQRIEGVRPLSSKTLTVSFKAKASVANFKVGVEFQQSFGNGGSAGVDSLNASVTLGTDWQQFSVQIAVPSVSGKTITDNDYLQLSFWLDAGANFAGRSANAGQKSGTVSITEVQVEEGAVMTPFEYRADAVELLLCRRYYRKSYMQSDAPGTFTNAGRYTAGNGANTNNINRFAVLMGDPMRAPPSVTVYGAPSGTAGVVSQADGSNVTAIVEAIGDASFNVGWNNNNGQWGGWFQWTADAEL